jgi:hypothetical protein
MQRTGEGLVLPVTGAGLNRCARDLHRRVRALRRCRRRGIAETSRRRRSPRGRRAQSGAMHVWPELRSLTQAIRRAATSKSASAATITGLLPPSSRVTGVSVGAAPAMIFRPISVPPVNSAWSKPWASRACVVAPSRYSGDETGKQSRSRRDEFGWFHHRAVARRHRRDQWPETEIYQVILRSDHEDHA